MNKTNINKILTLYSDNNIRIFIQQSLLSKNQVSTDYFFDKIKVQQIEDELVNKASAFRDACINPHISVNESIIRNNFLYLNDPHIRLNAQIRGPQCDLFGRIFRDCSLAGNSICNTSMSALSFSSSSDIQINTKETSSAPVVKIPDFFKKANFESFKNGLELTHANVISAVNNQEVVITGDKLVKVPPFLKVKNNLPFSQNKADIYRVVDKTAVFEDIKERSINVVISKKMPEPGSVFTGTLSQKEEVMSVSLVAQKAKTDIYNNSKTIVRSIFPEKDSIQDKVEVLNKVTTNISVKEQKELIGLAAVYSNKFHNPVKYSKINNNTNGGGDSNEDGSMI